MRLCAQMYVIYVTIVFISNTMIERDTNFKCDDIFTSDLVAYDLCQIYNTM
ncbi:hypothetical protein SCO01_14340 [Staphylococcus cohnii subsp. cohnii]|nr:hypothetical protein SCO01_14340 [Staphylococcus cohnii subsp. cohnii]